MLFYRTLLELSSVALHYKRANNYSTLLALQKDLMRRFIGSLANKPTYSFELCNCLKAKSIVYSEVLKIMQVFITPSITAGIN